MNAYPNDHDEEYADDTEDYGNGHAEGDGYGEDDAEAEARRQAEAYHAEAANREADYGHEPEEARHEPNGEAGGHDGMPRESRKERRRREAAERQARAEAEAAAMAMRGSPQPDASGTEVQAATNEAAVRTDMAEADPTEKSGKFGRWFGKRNREDRMGENRSGEPPIEIVLPSSDRIDPAALTEFGLDPNTLAAMGMDPATLPQFEPEFLVELGINPQIVLEILKRQKLAEMGVQPVATPAEHTDTAMTHEIPEPVSEAAKTKFDMSPMAWIARYRKVKKWAPAAAAAAGLTTTGSIWFMSGSGPEKPVEQVKNEQLAGDQAESALGDTIAKSEQDEPGIEPAEPAEGGIGDTQQAQAEPAPSDPAAEPVSLAMNDLPALPATPVDEADPAAGGLPALPVGETPPGLAAPEAPPGLDLPDAPPGLPADGLPGLAGQEAPPGIAPAEVPPGLPAMDAPGGNAAASDIEIGQNDPQLPGGAPANAEAASDASKKPGAAAKALAIPALGGLGAAAALAGSAADKAGGGIDIGKSGGSMPDLPVSTEAMPAEAPPGLPGLANETPIPNEAPPGLPAPMNEVPPTSGETAVANAPAELSGPETPLPTPMETIPGEGSGTAFPNASNVAKSIPNAGSAAGKAAVAGIAAGIGAGVATEIAANDDKPPGLPDLPNSLPPNDMPAPQDPVQLADEPPTERPPGIDPGSEPPGSLAGLPKDIPQTPAMGAKNAAAEERGKPADADATGPSIPNSRGKLLRALAATNPVGSGFGRSAAAAAVGTGAGLALGTAISGPDRNGGGSVAVQSMPAFDAAPPDIAPIRHTVGSGENFWTISRDFYGSGRYYKALWAANAARIGKIDELHVGDVVLIPAMENLDKSLIDSSKVAKSRRTGDDGAIEETPEVARSRDARAVRTRNEIESVPIGGEPGQKPARKVPVMSEPENPKEIVSQPIGETASTADYVRHRVRPGETLRTIAAARLGNARRADEIIELNSDVLEDIRTPLVPDMVLKLPVDIAEADTEDRN